MKVQVACTLHGKLAWSSDPVNGSRHDNYGLSDSGVLLALNSENWTGDKGYVGHDMITPFKKPVGGELLDWQKEFNTEVNKIRWVIEQGNLALQELADHAHRLPPSDQYVHDNHLSDYRTALLPNRLNKPQYGLRPLIRPRSIPQHRRLGE
jgi:hypothetical protein